MDHIEEQQQQQQPAPGEYYSMAVTCSLIERQFANVAPIADVTQLDALKTLLHRHMVRAAQYLAPFADNVQLQIRTVSAILPKLPAVYADEFRDTIGLFDNTLAGLKQFLQDKISPKSKAAESKAKPPVCELPKTAAAAVASSKPIRDYSPKPFQKLSSIKPAATDLNDPDERCNYCRSKDHTIIECAERSAQVCYNCQKPGHIARRCTDSQYIRRRLTEMMTHLARIPPENINLHKLATTLSHADNKIGHLWRDESLQSLVLDQVFAKLPPKLVGRFKDRCESFDKPITVRELKCFLYHEAGQNHNHKNWYKTIGDSPRSDDAQKRASPVVSGDADEELPDMLDVLDFSATETTTTNSSMEQQQQQQQEQPGQENEKSDDFIRVETATLINI